jgi:hypothetical protein
MNVVIEGWKEASLSDCVIDDLMNTYPEHVELLRRFRNGVFHYQSEMFDKRLTAFVENGSETLIWAFALFYEFKRFYWLYPENAFKHRDQRREFRIMLYQMIGWLPTDILHARAHKLSELGIEALSTVQNSGDPESPAAKELLDAITYLDDVARSIGCSPLLNELPRYRGTQTKSTDPQHYRQQSGEPDT